LQINNPNGMPKIIPQWWIDQTFKYAAFEHERDLPSLEGKVAIVTGASAGLGAETCLVLAKKGAHVFCMGRSKDKTMAVIDNIINTTGNKKVEFLQADFMDLKSVEKAAHEFLSRKLPLHILVNNAGIMACPYALSKDGIESQMATNHFAHALLTNILLPVIQASQPSRIVNLSSDAHRAFSRKGGIKYDELVDEKKYKSAVRYGETKIANIHFTIELQERLDAEARRQGYTQSQVYVNACHPGIVATELSRSLGTTYGRGTE
jgi:NAD(P)-dependent dehydrogenase (short-subunit alcohol dehydrogenase family)